MMVIVLLILAATMIVGCENVPHGPAGQPPNGQKESPTVAKEELRTSVNVDVSQNLGNMPEIFRAGVFEWGESDLPLQARSYLRRIFFSDLLPGMTTIFIPLGEGGTFREYKRRVEEEGLLDPVVEEAKSVVSGGGKILLDFSWMPAWLSSKPPEEKGEYFRYPPKDYAQWRDLITYTVRYLRQRGLKDAGYRIWEEVDLGITEDLKFWRGKDEEFVRLYRYSAEGIRSVDSIGKITFGLASYNSPILRTMARHVAKSGLPLDYVVWHPFRTPPYTQEYEKDVQAIRKILREEGVKGIVPIHAESWNSWSDFGKPNLSSGQPDDQSAERDTEYGAAYAIQTMFALESGGVSHQSFFTRVDPFHWKYLEAGMVKKDQQFYGDYGMFTRDLVIKPVYNAFKALSLLCGRKETQVSRRVAVTTDRRRPLTGLASIAKDRSALRVLLTNFVPSGETAKSYVDHVVAEYPKMHYGEALKEFEDCAKKKSLSDCSTLLPSDIQPFFRCIVEGKGEKCVSLMPQHVRTFTEKTAEFMSLQQTYSKEISLSVEKIPFHGKASLTMYRVDGSHANSCRYNKRTESRPSKTECGTGGIIDRMIVQARAQADDKAKEVVTRYPSLGDQIADIAARLFYTGTYITPDGKSASVTTSIDKINSDPEVSLEGSRSVREVTISNNGTFRDTITLPPNGIVFIEIVQGKR